MKQNGLYACLLSVGGIHAVLGLVFIIVCQTSFINPYIDELHAIFQISPSPETKDLTRFLLQLFGPTLSSWGVLFSLSVIHYRNTGNQRVKIMVLIATLLWYVIDCFLSYSYGVYSHLYLNTIVFIAIVIPLWLLQPQKRQP